MKSHDTARRNLGGAVPVQVHRSSEKTALAFGHHRDRPVVIKVLRSTEPFWRARFIHEIGIYRAFAESPPPVRVPELISTDGESVLVIERIDAEELDSERYPKQTVAPQLFDTALATTTAFSTWSAPPARVAPVFDYTARVERYHHAGFFDSTDRARLRVLLSEIRPEWQVNHGDPVPANLLFTGAGECVLTDFEFTGLFLPGFDLAVTSILLAGNPAQVDTVAATVSAAGIEVPFLINQAMVLSREIRLHTELDDSPLRRRRLALLDAEWEIVRARLHDA
ncbi:phosphotransferase [Nocardia sp. CNY236]|uniref:phosphotransferase n=1 Tax=Nocardia sp. CNY236 TaxID=1169152 RepID=UPI00040BFD3F|nr:phosphotransferase [Nocardia sp. CNY236]